MDSPNGSEGSDPSQQLDSEPGEQLDPETREQLDPETRKRLAGEADVLAGASRRQLFVLIFAGFFLMLTLSVPDSQLVRADASIRWPLVQTEIQLSTFVTFAPLALIGLLAYLHLLVGRLLQLRQEGFVPPEVDILAMTSRQAQLLANAILYAFVPLVLAWFSWKVVFRDEARFLIALTCFTALACAILYHRRAPAEGAKVRQTVIGFASAASVFGGALLLPWGDIRRAMPGLPAWEWRDPVMKLRMLDLKRANLGSADAFAIVNLASQNLRYADARFARLIGADLRDSDLTNANFRYALIGSDGSGVSMVTDFERAVLDGASIEEADLRNTHFDHASLVGADLEQAMLGDTRFWCADLSEAAMSRVTGAGERLVFQHARLDGAQHARAELGTPNFHYASLVGADLEMAIIEGGQFGFADLSEAKLGNGSFRDASFFEASLQDADLSYADLEGADFSGADLTGANLTGAYGIDFEDLTTQAFLCRTTDPQGVMRSDHCPKEMDEALVSFDTSVEPFMVNEALPHPCDRTENTGTDSFLMRLQRLFAGSN